MDLKFVATHMVSGAVPITAVLILYFLILHLFRRRQRFLHMVASFLFCFYLIGILTVTGVCLRGSFSPRMVYIPFLDMIRGPVDTLLNILLFLPLGFFLPMLYDQIQSMNKTAMAGFLFSLSIEAMQMFGYGVTDINDLIMNTFGACLGYGIYKMLEKTVPQSWHKWYKKIRMEGSLCFAELLFFWICSVLIMLTIQVHIFRVFFPMNGIEMQMLK